MSSQKHRDITQKIYEKNKHLLEKLPKEDRDYVEKKIDDHILRHETFSALDEGKRVVALKKYSAYLRRNPSELKKYKLHLRFLLPSRVFSALGKVYRTIRRKRAKRRFQKN